MRFGAARIVGLLSSLSETDSESPLASKVANIVRAHGRGMLRQLLRGTVIQALPVTAGALSVTALAEGWRIGDGVEVLGNVVVVVLLLPVVAWGGLWVSRSWVRAAEAVQPGGENGAASSTGGRAVRPVRRVWLAYLAGVLVLLLAAAAVPYVVSDNAAPIDLGNIPVAGFVLAFAGPLGLLSPIALLAARASAGRSLPGRSLPGAVPVLLSAAVAALAYSLLVGVLMYELTNALMADGLVAAVALIANLLTFPLPVVLISAGAAAWLTVRGD
jgi:hypothetical protein